MKAGIVSYEIVGDTLSNGKWSHVDIDNKIASEVVVKTKGEGIAGEYDVKIFQPNNQLLYSGTLTVTPVKAVFHLKWEGILVDNHKSKTFVGIGFIEGERYLIATFESVT